MTNHGHAWRWERRVYRGDGMGGRAPYGVRGEEEIATDITTKTMWSQTGTLNLHRMT